MILQALTSYYNRLKGDPEAGPPPPGFSSEKIHFAAVISGDGKLVQLRDLREGERKTPQQIVVPQAVKRSVGIASNFLWDNTGYVFGADNKGKPERSLQTFEAFKALQHEIAEGINDDGLKAVLAFAESWNPGDAVKLEGWDGIAGGNVVFQLDGELGYVHERVAARDAWLRHRAQAEPAPEGFCLVTGKRAPVARLHSAIKGVRGAQSSGAAIVSFNLDAFCSWGKEQNFNAPVSEESAFAYATVLNHLLRSGSRQKIQIGDATTVFWAERESPVEGFLGMIFDPRDDAADIQQIRLCLEAMRDGKALPGVDPDVIFYVLGLAPNASRLAVRFWHVSTIGDVTAKVGQHFRDLQIVRDFDNQPEFPGIWWLLRETAVQGKSENVPPLLAGAIMRSILTGGAYPASLLSQIITRIRADHTINYLRTAIIKACLVRQWRIAGMNKEITMTLDMSNTNPAYLLGRLFAALEKAQKDAVPGANTTIKDRFFGSASATPRSVFPQLIRLAQHHIQKAEYGRFTDKLIEEIIAGITEFPAHLALDDQGLFAIGYYHQRRAFFEKRTQPVAAQAEE